MKREHFIQQTISWLNRRVAPAGVVVDADTRLFERGIVDSLGVLRLIAWTEKQIGRRIADREIRMDRFGSVRAIAENFVDGGVAAESFAESAVAADSFAAGATQRRGGRACARCGRCAVAGTAACPRRAA